MMSCFRCVKGGTGGGGGEVGLRVWRLQAERGVVGQQRTAQRRVGVRCGQKHACVSFKPAIVWMETRGGSRRVAGSAGGEGLLLKATREQELRGEGVKEQARFAEDKTACASP